MEAGVGTLTRMPEGSFDLAMVVTDSSAKSIEVARRALEIITERRLGPVLLIANSVREERDLEVIRGGLGPAEIRVIPEDPAILRADRDGFAPYDVARDSPGVRAMIEIARALA